MFIDLKGKTAFITGGASGMGLGIAKACAREGMNVAIADFRQSAIDEAIPWFEKHGFPVMGVNLDVTDREGYVKAADAVEAKFGKIHVLVNNAGIGNAEPKLTTGEFDWKTIDLCIDVNYRGILNGIGTILPRITKHGEGGYVVSTASMSGIFPVKGFPMYDSLKMGVITLMEELAMELEGTNVGSAAFCPGPYSTNLGVSSQEVIKKHLGEDALPKMPARREPPKDKDGKPLPMPKFEPPKDENGNPIDFSKLSRDPDDAGERVVRGIKRGDKFIFTHVDFKPGWELRMNAILRAFPDEKPTPGFATVFRGNIYNPIYEQQEQVPAFEFVKKD